ncbi:MAG: ABC transporter substrate-binding protein [Parvibaculaceae bacterium]
MTNTLKWRGDLAASGIDRRTFFQGALAFGTSLATIGVPASQLGAATPKRGGHLKVGLAGGSTTDSWDPALYADTFMQVLGMGMCFNCLTEVSASGELVPELAERWEASSDAKTWTFELRKGVTFHNGKSFEAADVVETIRHHKDEQSKSYAKALVSRISEMRIDNQHRITFSLEDASADFPYLLSDYHLTILPAGHKEEALSKGIGTGGYIVERFEPGVAAIAKRNPNYFKQDRAYFDSVELIGISDSTARMNALLTAEVDVVNRVDLKTEHLLRANKDIDIFEVTGNQHFTFPMNTTLSPFDSNDVRLALKYAIDREALVQKILQGHGRVANDNPIGPANKYYTEDLEKHSFDPDKARFHLRRAGLSSLSVRLSAADAAFAGAVDAAVLYSQSAKSAGIEIEVVQEPNDGYWTNVWRKKPWCASYWSGRATADWMLTDAYEVDSSQNETYWRDDTFNKLLVEARRQLDEAKRGEMYRELQQMIHDKGGVVIPMYANYVDAASRKLAHESAIGNIWQLDGARLAERWWFA